MRKLTAKRANDSPAAARRPLSPSLFYCGSEAAEGREKDRLDWSSTPPAAVVFQAQSYRSFPRLGIVRGP